MQVIVVGIETWH